MRHMGRQGMVASPHYLATAAGVKILRQGGNAVDAAIAVNAVLAVVTPYLCGLGGDLFALVYRRNDRSLIGLNGSGRAPAEATVERIRAATGGDRMPERGPLSVTVPGCVDGWGALHQRFCRLPFADLLRDAIGYAEEGFPVSARCAEALRYVAPILHPETPAPDTFLPAGTAPTEGQVFLQPRLGQTLRSIADEGPSVFYRGSVARELVRSIRAIGGLLALDDLHEHHADWVAPLSAQYRDVTVYELPPNSQGIVALLMLSVLDQVSPSSLATDSAGYIHYLAEAARLAYADRDTFITDPQHMVIDPSALLSQRYSQERAGRLRARAPHEGVVGQPGDTAYLCTADGEGTLVSLIESNYMGIGSGVMAGETGVMVQNRGAAFSLTPGHPNVIMPHKRTMHTLMPGLAFRAGRPWLVFGTMGGSTQPQIHVQILTRLIDQGMQLDDAIDAPRFDAVTGADDRGRPLITLEDRFPHGVTGALTGLGYGVKTVESYSSRMGHAHAIEILDNDVLIGAADPRTDSLALGY